MLIYYFLFIVYVPKVAVKDRPEPRFGIEQQAVTKHREGNLPPIRSVCKVRGERCRYVQTSSPVR